MRHLPFYSRPGRDCTGREIGRSALTLLLFYGYTELSKLYDGLIGVIVLGVVYCLNHLSNFHIPLSPFKEGIEGGFFLFTAVAINFNLIVFYFIRESKNLRSCCQGEIERLIC